MSRQQKARRNLRRPIKEIVAEIRAEQAAPVDPNAEVYAVLCPPVPQNPETQAALADLVRAALKAAKAGTLPRKEGQSGGPRL